jgi:hypothetical protein
MNSPGYNVTTGVAEEIPDELPINPIFSLPDGMVR